jgi:hypothetical protein
MNYKTRIAIWACLMVAISARAELSTVIATTDGQTYNGVSLIRMEPDGYLVNYEPVKNGMGIAKIKFSRLAAEQQKQAGYDPGKAREFEAQVAKATEDWQQQNQRWEQAARTERQAQQFREDQEAQIAIQRVMALAQLKQAEAELAHVSPGDGGTSWGSVGGGIGAVAIPEIGNGKNVRASFTPNPNNVLEPPPRFVRPAIRVGIVK